MADLATLRAGGWEEVALPEVVARYPTMLTLAERRLLHWLARDVWEGWGAIVDAGSFLGGSTVSLATGLKARATTTGRGAPPPVMTTYDLFKVEQYALDAGYFERWPALTVGDNFRHAFDELLGELAAETHVREGDVTAERWTGGPIEILFLDLLKATSINDAVLPEFMPSLVAGRSLVIQQDYVHGMLPWIHITMELLEDSLTHVADVAGSRVYAVTRELPAERLAEFLPLDERVPAARQQQLMRQATTAAAGDTRGHLLLAEANLLRAQGELATAGALLQYVEREYADAPSVQFDIGPTRQVLQRYGWVEPPAAA